MSEVVNELPIGKSGFGEAPESAKVKSDQSGVSASQPLGIQVQQPQHPHSQQLMSQQQQQQPQLGQQMSHQQQYPSRQPQPISSAYLNYYNNGYHPHTYQYNYAPFSYYGGAVAGAGQVGPNAAVPTGGSAAPNPSNASGASAVGGMTAVPPASDSSYLQVQQMHQQQQQQQQQQQAQQQPAQSQQAQQQPQVNDYHVQQFSSYSAPGPEMVGAANGAKKTLRSKPKAKEDVGSPSGATTGRPYTCEFPDCQWSFARQSDLRRHAKLHSAPMFHCPYWRNDPTCHRNGGAFNRLDVLKRHLRLVHYVQDKHQGGAGSRSTSGKDDAGWCRACQRMFPLSKAFVDHCMACAQLILPAEWKSLSSRYPYEQMGMMQYQQLMQQVPQMAQNSGHSQTQSPQVQVAQVGPGAAQSPTNQPPAPLSQQPQQATRANQLMDIPGDYLIDKDIKGYQVETKKRSNQTAGGATKKSKS
jgi:hypothetical protein